MTVTMPEKVLDKLVGRILLRRMGEPEDVAEVVAYFLDDASAYVTGQVVYV